MQHTIYRLSRVLFSRKTESSKLAQLRLLLIGLLALLNVSELVSRTESKRDTVESSVIRAVKDFDDDGTMDTLYATKRVWLLRGVNQRQRIQPSKIHWGRESDTLALDSTILSVPFPQDGRTSHSIYDYNEDGVPDIILNWWWSSGDSGKVKDRLIAVLGGDDLRGVDEFKMNSRSAVPNRSYTIRLDKNDSTSTRISSRGGIVVRSRSRLPRSRPKVSPQSKTTPDEPVQTITASPNPAASVLMVRVKDSALLNEHRVAVTIVDENGRTVMHRSHNPSSLSRGVEYDVSLLPSGAYTVLVSNHRDLISSTRVAVLR